MLIYENGKWQLATHIVKFTHIEGYREVYTIDTQYWLDFAEMWKENFTLHEILEFTPSEEQKMRYENIKNMPEDFSDIYSQYVEDGTILDVAHLLVTHPFVAVVTKLTEAINRKRIDDLEASQSATNTLLLEFMESSLLP